MKIIREDRVICFDIDDTIITFNIEGVEEKDLVMVGEEGFERPAAPMTRNINGLKQARARGHYTVVWSQGGHAWAEKVIKALKLEEYVDMIISKPNWIYDDLPVEKWMGHRFWFARDEKDE